MLILFLWTGIFINTKGPWLTLFLRFVSCPASLLHESMWQVTLIILYK